PHSTPFPYTTLFRSCRVVGCRVQYRLCQEFHDIRFAQSSLAEHGSSATHEIAHRNLDWNITHPSIAEQTTFHCPQRADLGAQLRSEEHTSELQSLAY